MSTSHGCELDTGDIAFEYQPRHSNVDKFLLINFLISIVMCLILWFASHYENGYILCLLIIPVVAGFYNVKNTLTRNENIDREKIAAFDALTKDRIAEIYNAKKKTNVLCKNLSYHVYRKGFGEYGRRIIALMSDGNVITFKVVQRNNGLEQNKWLLTIRKDFDVASDYKTASKVLSWWEGLQWLSPERNAKSALICILLIWIVLTAFWGGIIYWLKLYILALQLGIMALQYMLLVINRYIQVPSIIFKIVEFPFELRDLWIKFTAPVLSLLFGLFVLVCLNVLLITSLYGIYWLTNGMPALPESINYELLTFISLASFSMFSVYGNRCILAFCDYVGLLSVVESKSLKQPILGITEYVYQRQNINAVIYILYFLFFAITAFLHFVCPENDQYLFGKGIDDSIAKAFLLHIAFTNMVAKRKESKFTLEDFRDRLFEILNLRD